MRIADLEGLCFLHACKASLNLELPIDLAILFPVMDEIIVIWRLGVIARLLLSGSLSSWTNILLLFLRYLLLLLWLLDTAQPRRRPNLDRFWLKR